MNVNKLTLADGETDRIHWLSPGFGYRLRRTTKGVSRQWVVQYRIGKQQRRVSLDADKFNQTAASKIARDTLAKVQLGQDPAADRHQPQEAAPLLLGDVSDRYLAAKRDVMRPAPFRLIERHFQVQWQPLANRPIAEVRRAEIAALLQQLVQRHGRSGAGSARRTLSAMFGWAMREGLVESNPVASTNDPDAGAKSRDRVLSDDELRRVWLACGDDDFGRIVRLLILTACRRNEIGWLKWSEINLDTGVMVIPAERSKNHREHRLSLPPMAVDIIRTTPRRGSRDFLFGESGGGFSRCWHRMQPLRQRVGDIKPWVLHDLRRSAATGMAEIGIRPEIIEAILNHVGGHKGGVAGIYNRATYAPQMAAALQRWADHVAALIEGRPASNVTPMRRA
jgi:integrase